MEDKKIKLAIFAVGALLRLSMTWRYDASWGFDGGAHWAYIQAISHGTLPDPTINFIAYHPPLYHAIAAGLVKLGASWQGLIWLSVACGVGRLAIIWAGLETCLESRKGRIAALALAAVMPSSIMIDGMVSNESLNGLLCAAAMLLWLKGKSSLAIGMLSGLAMLVKTSAIAMLAGFGVRRRLMAAAVCLAVIPGLYLLRGHSPFSTTYEIAPGMMGHVEINTPYLSRRGLDFLGWDWRIFQNPYHPTALPGFFPVLVASTFTDNLNHGFSGLPPERPREMTVNGRPMTRPLMWLARLAMAGGTLIFIGTFAAWLLSVRRVIRDEKWDLLSLLIVPLLATLLAMAFAVKYPYDNHGVIKSAYVQFAAPPLYAMFGLAAERWPALWAGLALVAAYSFYCRLI